jgi:hypothetical protein
MGCGGSKEAVDGAYAPGGLKRTVSGDGSITLRGVAGLSEDELHAQAKTLAPGASLDLCGSGITKAEIDVFFPSLWKSGLRALDVSKNGLGPDCVLGIADLIRATPMEELRAGGNPFGPEGIQGIANAIRAQKTLRMLDVRETNAGPAGARALAGVLTAGCALTSLDLDANAIADDGATALMEAATTQTHVSAHGQIVKLSLRKNGLTAAVAKPLAGLLKKHPTLETFAISENDLGSATASALSTALYSNMVLRELDVKGCNFGSGLQNFVAVIDSHLVTLVSFTSDATKAQQSEINTFLERNRRTSAAKQAAEAKDAAAAARRAAAADAPAGPAAGPSKKDVVEPVDEYTRAVLKDMLHVASPEELGKGFDVQNELQQKYTELEFVQAWKIVNDDRTRRYDASKQLISTQCDDLRASGIKVPDV